MELSQKVVLLMSVSFLLNGCGSFDKGKSNLAIAQVHQQWFDGKYQLICGYTLLPPKPPKRFTTIAPKDMYECTDRVAVNLVTNAVDWSPKYRSPFRI